VVFVGLCIKVSRITSHPLLAKMDHPTSPFPNDRPDKRQCRASQDIENNPKLRKHPHKSSDGMNVESKLGQALSDRKQKKITNTTLILLVTPVALWRSSRSFCAKMRPSPHQPPNCSTCVFVCGNATRFEECCDLLSCPEWPLGCIYSLQDIASSSSYQHSVYHPLQAR